MKKIFYVGFLFLAGLCSCNSSKNDGWVSLFNGKDLTGWKQLGGEAKFEVVDGIIVGKAVLNTPSSFLTTEKNYSDFIFEADVKVGRLNSGIQFRSQSLPEYRDGRVHGYQCEIDPGSRAWSGGIFDQDRRGWLYPLDLNQKARKAFKRDDWNHYRIECIGNSIRTWINGVPAAHLIDDMTPKGFISLQIHSVSSMHEDRWVMWKNIRIKTERLQPSSPDSVFIVNIIDGDLSESEKSQGWGWFWDGTSADSWKNVESGSFPKDRWSLKEGVLTVLGTEGETTNKLADIFLNKPLSSFELQWKFMFSQGATSGLMYLSDPISSSGLEFQIQEYEAPDDTIATHSLASLYGLKASAIKGSRYVNGANEWNHARIIIRPDNKVEHWLGGIKVLEYSLNDEDIKGILPQVSQTRNVILKDEGSQVSFRDFKIRSME